MAIHTEEYDKHHKTNNSVFRLENKNFVQVLNLQLYDEDSYAEVTYLKVENLIIPKAMESDSSTLPPIDDVQFNHLFEVKERLSTAIIAVKELKEKCVFMKLPNKTYISTLPNVYEIQ